MTNDGTIKTWSTAFNYTGTFTNNGTYYSDPADNYFNNLVVTKSGVLKGGTGDRFFVRGDFLSTSQQRNKWDTRSAEVIMDSELFAPAEPAPPKLNGAGGFAQAQSSPAPHVFEVTGANLGPRPQGYANNFAWGVVVLAKGNTLWLRDGAIAPGRGAYVGGGLYVSDFELGGGVSQIPSVHGDGVDIYYNPTTSGDQYLHDRTYALAGGGVLQPVASAHPEHAAHLTAPANASAAKVVHGKSDDAITAAVEHSSTGHGPSNGSRGHGAGTASTAGSHHHASPEPAPTHASAGHGGRR